MSDPLERLLGFTGELRAEGIDPGPDRSRVFCEAVALLPPEDLYLAGRASLVSGHEQLAGYDRAFRRYFGVGRLRHLDEPEAAPADGARTGGEGEPSDVDEAVAVGEDGASATRVLRAKRFAECSDAELRRLAELLVDLPPRLPRRRTRRHRRDRRGAPDLRRLARQAGRTWGEPVAIPRRRRTDELRPLLVVIDASGSMKDHNRGALVLALAALRLHPRTEVYAFGTELTRLTEVLRAAPPEQAPALVAALAWDWEGGTRIGAGLTALLAERRTMNRVRGGVTIVVSDGLDTGEPEDLRRALARLARGMHRLVWLNPLASRPGYEPLARGMRAALPYLDGFGGIEDLADLQADYSPLASSSSISPRR